ncbi:alpha/beta hydrolase family protein [Marinibactrum halimedae]|uniref:Peptidase S9 n=1 Tax=Marinibactrum halimedae TaxID=1444977 RepID=A0AA37T647_9GAMM|nr:S9 family peptidase [Marinibactrum halimedae]MCD9461278.1 S9 family peptidase [Marinibactrum halimedae]GLS27329.1 peptidase S9 [Marinibactrum halimedae]
MKVFLLVSLLITPFAMASALKDIPVSLEMLLQPNQHHVVKISPDGEKVGVIATQNGRKVLVTLQVEPLKALAGFEFEDDGDITYFRWVNNERLVAELGKNIGWLDRKQNDGQIYATNYDGKNKKRLFGIHAGDVTTGTMIQKRKSMKASAEVIHTLPDQEKYVLISTYPFKKIGNYYYGGQDTVGAIYRLNVYSGKTYKEMSHPSIRGRGYANNEGEIVFASGVSTEAQDELYIRKDDQWAPIPLSNGSQAVPVSFSIDNRFAYLLSNHNRNLVGLYQYDLTTHQQKLLYEHDSVDVSDVIINPKTGHVVGALLHDGKPQYHFLDNDDAFVKFFKGILHAFPDHWVEVVSSSENGDRFVVKVSSSENPGEFLIADSKKKTVNFLFAVNKNLSMSTLASTKPISYVAQDGKNIPGYLTLPSSSEKSQKPLPMVVVPHGGPIARDIWKYNREVQILANAGYAVLQINFRGSSGYGKDFHAPVWKDWGGLVQQDIADGVKWAIDQKIADKNRVCIYGASFGAYSAMMNVILHPELYQCAAAFAGVYDLGLLFKSGDISKKKTGRQYLKYMLGQDEEKLHNYSPLYRIDEVTKPVFVAHGHEDFRAPVEHAQKLVDELKKHKKDVTTHFNKGGGHGFVSVKANTKYYEDLLKFLDQHLKK